MVNYKDIVSSIQLDTADEDNPDGVFQDYVANSKPGTPIVMSWFQTPYYFFRRLIFEALGQEPNGDIDNLNDNQAFDALETYTKSKVSDVTDDMQTQIDNQNIMFNFNKYDGDKIIDTGSYTDNVSQVKYSSYDDGDASVSSGVTCGVDNPIASTTWVACALNGSLKVAVASGKIAYKSDESSSWVSQNITGVWVDVIYSEFLDLFIAIKDGAYSTSSDGITWTETAVTGSWTHLTSDDVNEYILIVASDGSVTYSKDLSTWGTSSLSEEIDSCFSMNGYLYVISDDKLYKGVFQSGGLTFNSIYEYVFLSNALYAVNPSTNLIFLHTSNNSNSFVLNVDGDGNIDSACFTNSPAYQIEAMGIDFKGFLIMYTVDGSSIPANIYKL